jgi:1,4-dihydroxy-2-naphthoyl-CoA hydrolase
VTPPRSTWVPDDFDAVVTPARSFDALYGLEVLDDGSQDGLVRGRVQIRDELRQPFGLLHGGVLAAAAESLASGGTWLAVHGDGMLVMGLSNETSFLRPLRDGCVHISASARHRGATRWVWAVEFRDDEGRLCAVTTVNIAVRPARHVR